MKSKQKHVNGESDTQIYKLLLKLIHGIHELFKIMVKRIQDKFLSYGAFSHGSIATLGLNAPPSLCPHRSVLTLYYNDDTEEGCKRHKTALTSICRECTANVLKNQKSNESSHKSCTRVTIH